MAPDRLSSNAKPGHSERVDLFPAGGWVITVQSQRPIFCQGVAR
jgi:hypothetical protein